MKCKAILVSILSLGMVAATAAGQKTFKSTASVRLVTSGSQVIVVPARGTSLTGGKLATRKAASTLAGATPRITTTLGASKSAGLATSGTNLTKTVLGSGATLTASGAIVLAPGQSISIGATGSRISANLSSTDTTIVSAPATAAATSISANPLAATVERQVFAGDLIRDTTAASSGLQLGTIATSAGTVTTGANGFPVFAGGTATAQSGTNPIGPNGFPQPVTAGPQSGIQPINPNGFPATNVAPFAQTGMTRAGTTRDATAIDASAAGSRAVTAGTTAIPALTSPAAALGTGTTGTSTAAGSTSSTAAAGSSSSPQ